MKNASLTLMVLALGLAGCDRSAAPDASAAAAAPAATAPAASSGGNDAVQAVLQSQGTPVARLQFVLPSRPVAGTPFPLQLHVSAPSPVPALQLGLESASLVAEPATAVLAIEAANAPVVQEVMLTAQAAGLLDLTVRLKGADSAEAVYAVPVLVAAAAAAP